MTEIAAADDPAYAVADALLHDSYDSDGRLVRQSYEGLARAAVAAYERWVLDHRPDAGRLGEINEAINEMTPDLHLEEEGTRFWVGAADDLLAALAVETARAEHPGLHPLVEAAAELLAALDEHLAVNARPRRLQGAADRLRHQVQRAQAR